MNFQATLFLRRCRQAKHFQLYTKPQDLCCDITMAPEIPEQTPEQAADFAKKAVEQNQLQPSRRDPYERVVGWLLPRTGR